MAEEQKVKDMMVTSINAEDHIVTYRVRIRLKTIYTPDHTAIYSLCPLLHTCTALNRLGLAASCML